MNRISPMNHSLNMEDLQNQNPPNYQNNTRNINHNSSNNTRFTSNSTLRNENNREDTRNLANSSPNHFNNRMQFSYPTSNTTNATNTLNTTMNSNYFNDRMSREYPPMPQNSAFMTNANEDSPSRIVSDNHTVDIPSIESPIFDKTGNAIHNSPITDAKKFLENWNTSCSFGFYKLSMSFHEILQKKYSTDVIITLCLLGSYLRENYVTEPNKCFELLKRFIIEENLPLFTFDIHESIANSLILEQGNIAGLKALIRVNERLSDEMIQHEDLKSFIRAIKLIKQRSRSNSSYYDTLIEYMQGQQDWNVPINLAWNWKNLPGKPYATTLFNYKEKSKTYELYTSTGIPRVNEKYFSLQELKNICNHGGFIVVYQHGCKAITEIDRNQQEEDIQFLFDQLMVVFLQYVIRLPGVQFITPTSSEIRSLPQDGNDVFRILSSHLLGQETTHELRNSIVDYLKAKYSIESIESYRQLNYWNDENSEIILQGLADYFKIRIIVVNEYFEMSRYGSNSDQMRIDNYIYLYVEYSNLFNHSIYKLMDSDSFHSPTTLSFSMTKFSQKLLQVLPKVPLYDQTNANESEKIYNLVYGYTSLMRAANSSNMHLLSELIRDTGDNINLQNRIGWNALMFAVSSGNCEGAELLMKNGAQRSCRNNLGISCVMIAAYNLDHQMLQLLLEYGAQIDVPQHELSLCTSAIAIHTPIMYVCDARKSLVIPMMLCKYRPPPPDECNVLILEILKLLFPYNPKMSVDNLGMNAFMYACNSGNLYTIQSLYEYCSQLPDFNINLRNKKNQSALMIAKRNKDYDVIQYLEDHGAKNPSWFNFS